MQICNINTFKGKTELYQDGSFKIKDSFDDNNILKSHIVFDEFDRVIIAKKFDIDGFIDSNTTFDYYETNMEKGMIETYKDKSQEYIRNAYTKIENSLKHKVDDYTSISNPKNSYINDFVYDLKGNLCKLISNGKETIIRSR